MAYTEALEDRIRVRYTFAAEEASDFVMIRALGPEYIEWYEVDEGVEDSRNESSIFADPKRKNELF
jgi:hypothetical protein